MKVLIRLLDRKKFLFSFILATVFSICEYGTSFALAYYTTSPFNIDKIIWLSVILIILYIIMNVTHWFNIYISNTLYPIYKSKVQNHYFNELQSMSFKNITATHTGYIYNLIKDVANLSEESLRNIEETVLPLLIGTVSFIIMACKQSVIMGMLCILVSVVAVYLKYKMMVKRQNYEKETRVEYSKYISLLIDFIQNITIVRKLNLGKFCNNKMDAQIKVFNDKLKINESKRANHNTVFHVLIRSIYVIVLLSTIFMVRDGKDALPYLLFYMTLLGNLYRHINNMAKVLDTKVQFTTAFKQINCYFEDNMKLNIIYDFKKLEMIDVKTVYNDESAKIVIPYLKIEKGDKISISGTSGQGKTTTLNLLAGILDNNFLRIDDKNYENSKIDSVFVSQEADLFDLSVRDNLVLDKDISDMEIVELLNHVGMMEWYEALPDGLNTMVGEKGIKLSAGQKQRLILIRAILMNKELYLFDEPTSNLDNESEEKVIETIEKYLDNKTYVIVTHRERIKRLCNTNYIFKNHVLLKG